MRRVLLGVRAVREALAAHAQSIAVIYVHEEGARGALRDVVTDAKNRGVSIEFKPMEELNALAEGDRHQGVIGLSGEDFAYASFDELLDRTVAASPSGFLVALDETGIVTMKDRAAPVTPTVVRASAGATEHAAIARVTNLSRALDAARERGLWTVGLDAEGSATLAATDLTVPCVVVVGSEGRGLRRLVRERCDVLAKIPMSGPIASLNASVAAAITLYELTRQRAVAAAR
jgi:23S rRNA (guanosine2251-2'-O)-methyltransferase